MKVLPGLLFLIIITGDAGCAPGKQSTITPGIIKLEMNLSAFGVESDHFPSIHVIVDFEHDSSLCIKSYYNPAFKGSEYRLSQNEISQILSLLQKSDLDKLKPEYRVDRSDQPTSTTTVYTLNHIFVIKDYGLEGNFPLQDLYKIVYK